MEKDSTNAGMLVRATCQLRWIEDDAVVDGDFPTAEAPGWSGPRKYKLQQFWANVGGPGGMWRDVKIDYDE